MITALYFDGRTALARPVELRLHDGRLRVSGEGVALDLDAQRLDWPEHQRHGPRVLVLPDDIGGQIHCADGGAWDHWLADQGHRHGRLGVVRMQQSWRATLMAVALMLLLVGLMFTHGLPLIAHVVLGMVPTSLDQRVGEEVFEHMEAHWLSPSQVPVQQQERLREQLRSAMARVDHVDHGRDHGEAEAPAWELRFRRSRDKMPGANALALPGGVIVVTDELVALLHDREDVLLGVLAHEMGHVRQRHGMRMLVQGSLLAIATGLLFNDAGSVVGLLSSAPLLLGQMAYSRDMERDADEHAIAVLQANRIEPMVLAVLFERLQAGQATTPDGVPEDVPHDWGIGFSSHPPTKERIERLKAASHP
ncbi:M48 family metallopeptidase [Leptothrix ochracea]|uniref:M48 family metallopeptidase n=1 Tax=Leptothrix ochracea TaxID=735331 RepID=UPI0034E22F0F